MKRNAVLKIAFIGTGNIAAQHMRAMKSFPDVLLAGVCDTDIRTLGARTSEFGVDAFTSIVKLLESVSPDAVFICLPPYAHGEAEMACIRHGIPFLVEKPLSNDLAVAVEIDGHVKSADLLTCAAYMNRYRIGVQLAKGILEKHHPALINGGWLTNVPRGHPWLTKKQLSGGQLVEQITHIFDLIRYLCGEVASVYCCSANGLAPRSDTYDIEDATVVSLRMKSGAVASIQSSWSAGFTDTVYLRFFGPEVRVEFEGWNQNARLTTRTFTLNIQGEEDIFAIEDRAFLDAVRTGNPSSILSDYSEGVRSLRLSIIANKSLETGKEINV